MDQRSIRRYNLGLVLSRVARGPHSRARLARETGLNKTTISSLVAELIELGLIAERNGVRTGGIGRPPQDVELDGRTLVALGVELAADHVASAALDLRGEVRHHSFLEQDNTRRAARELVRAVADVAEGALESITLQRLEPVAITIAVPGLVEFGSGTVAVAPNLRLREVAFADLLAARLGRPGMAIYVDNEANLGALAEHTDGVARDCPDFLYVSAGVGIGAGVVIDGDLYRGAHGFSGELGHMTIRRDGPECACGARGCLEVYAGLRTLVRRAGVLGEATDSRSSIAVLADRARRGDLVTLRALSEVGETLGVAVASIANAFDPRMVVLGGYVPALAEWLLPALERELRPRVLERAWTLSTSALGREAPARGASRMALRAVLEDPAGVLAVARHQH